MSESRSLEFPTFVASTAQLGSCRMWTEVTGAITLTSLAPALLTPNYPSLNCQLHLPRGKIGNVQIESSNWKFPPARIPLTGSSSSSRIPTLTPSPSKNVGSHLKSSMESLDDLEWDNEVGWTDRWQFYYKQWNVKESETQKVDDSWWRDPTQDIFFLFLLLLQQQSSEENPRWRSEQMPV